MDLSHLPGYASLDPRRRPAGEGCAWLGSDTRIPRLTPSARTALASHRAGGQGEAEAAGAGLWGPG